LNRLFINSTVISALTAFWTREPLIWAAVIITVILVCIAALYCGITVKRYEIETDRLKEGEFVRILHLSDLHSTRYGKKQKNLIDNIRQLMPDIIFFTGDNVDDLRKPDSAYELFEGIKKLGIPMFFVIGNHELRIKDHAELYSKLHEYGVEVLDMSAKKVRSESSLIYIAGTPDPWTYADEEEYSVIFKSTFADIKNISQIRLLLAHRPEKWEQYKDAGFDIAFSGHAHGGQVRIPKLLNGLYAPHQGLFPKRAGGIYCDDGFIHIVSRGLSRSWDLPRIFNPPEIVLCVLKGTDNNKYQRNK